MTDNRMIVALDFHCMDQVKSLVTNLGDNVNYYKVGMELFYSVGSCVIEYLRNQNKEVFLDLKLHDIPNTTSQGLCSLTKLGVAMLNVHASGGYTMMKNAVESLQSEADKIGVIRPKLIAVTVLTSIHTADWEGLGQKAAIQEQVVHLAKLAKSAGLDGVVASPQEAAAIRKACGDGFMIVTPGVRPAGASVNDQSRIATPKNALLNGATHLVIGRPITAAENPREAALKIIKEMEDVR
ncbi:orotidine-5'-phosphate decarboxylase [Anaerosinus massiliensis]|uniref:orotidine-5'-phosphate decarboxylase n=1 Tax=Massilibacillus massiliensis TaxID=1806837 RepID=UPI000A7D3F04|nr:orotidine-5'-phosphate decarboxylase [Massilibacillus massiliensis]